MRRHRLLIVSLCLLALVGCQLAMAGRWCHGWSTDMAAASAPCHEDATRISQNDHGKCPVQDLVPDLGKLPIFAPLGSGHDFVRTLILAEPGSLQAFVEARPRDGPDLDRLCRLLI